MKNVFLRVVFIFVLAFSNLFALTGTDGLSVPVLDLGLGARPLAMGGAFTSVADDGNAGYWNPAGLGECSKINLSSMYTTLFLGTKFFYISLSVPLDISFQKSITTNEGIKVTGAPEARTTEKFGALSLVWVESFLSGLKNTQEVLDPVTGAPYIQLDDFESKDDLLFLSYGIRFIKYFGFGANGKIIRRKITINDTKASGYGADMGVMVYPINGLKIGCTWQDVGNTKLNWSYINEVGEKVETVENSVSRLRGGLSFDFATLFNENNLRIKTNTQTSDSLPAIEDVITKMILSFDIRWQISQHSSPTYHVGMEWMFFRAVSLRLGVDDVNFSAGVGLYRKPVTVDYAYVTHPELQNTHRISLSVEF